MNREERWEWNRRWLNKVAQHINTTAAADLARRRRERTANEARPEQGERGSTPQEGRD
jgi:hypothetical protein